MTVAEADRGDHRAVLAAVNALGANQRDLTERVGGVQGGLTPVEERLAAAWSATADTGMRLRSLEDSVAEMKDLLVRTLGR